MPSGAERPPETAAEHDGPAENTSLASAVPIALLGAYAAAFAAWVLWGGGTSHQRTVISDVAFLPVDLAAVACAVRGMRHPAPVPEGPAGMGADRRRARGVDHRRRRLVLAGGRARPVTVSFGGRCLLPRLLPARPRRRGVGHAGPLRRRRAAAVRPRCAHRHARRRRRRLVDCHRTDDGGTAEPARPDAERRLSGGRRAHRVRHRRDPAAPPAPVHGRSPPAPDGGGAAVRGGRPRLRPHVARRHLSGWVPARRPLDGRPGHLRRGGLRPAPDRHPARRRTPSRRRQSSQPHPLSRRSAGLGAPARRRAGRW